MYKESGAVFWGERSHQIYYKTQENSHSSSVMLQNVTANSNMLTMLMSSIVNLL